VITGIKAFDLPKTGHPKKTRGFYVMLAVDGKVKKTQIAAKGNAPVWQDTFEFEAFTSSMLELKVYAHRTLLTDDYVGDVKETVGILASAEGGVVKRVLVGKDTKCPPQASLEFTINSPSVSQPGERAESAIDAAEVAKESNLLAPGFGHADNTMTATDNQMVEGINQATHALVQMDNAPSAIGRGEDAVSSLNTVVNEITGRVGSWQPLLEKLQLFKDVVDKITEVHPYAKMAWSILSAIPQALLTQLHLDESVRGLFATMVDVYSFVLDADPLKSAGTKDRTKAQQKIVEILVAMAAQTTECAYFIRVYAEKRSFWLRAMKHIVSHANSQIQTYQTKFTQLCEAYSARAMLDIEISVLRILDDVDNLVSEVQLDDMPYAEGAKYDPYKQCLGGTRQQIIEEIT